MIGLEILDGAYAWYILPGIRLSLKEACPINYEASDYLLEGAGSLLDIDPADRKFYTQ